VLVDQFIASLAQPPLSLTFDLDAVDDPTHGSQQLTLLHASGGQYQYLPSVTTSAETEQVVMARLGHGTAAASVVVSCRRAVARSSGGWPNRGFCGRIGQHVSARPAVAHFWAG
jgi:hypothetical protein